jgi:hypothetical protein
MIVLAAGCATPSEPKPFPPPEGYSSWDEYHERNQKQAEMTPEPTLTEEPETPPTPYETEPLAYEVVESYTDKDSYNERRRIVIGGEVFQDEVVEVFYPVGCVTLQNTDKVDKLDAAIAGQGLSDFKFDDYLAAEDPDSYLDSLDWDNLDWDKIMIFCEEYNRQENITLQPSETGTVTASVQDIDIGKMAWKWEYTIIAPTKMVEK